MKFNPDFSEATRIAPGTYPVKAVSCDSYVSSNNNPYARWKLKIIGGDFDGRSVYINTVMRGTGANILRQFLTAINPSYSGGSFEAEDYLWKVFHITFASNGSNSPFPNIALISQAPNAA